MKNLSLLFIAFLFLQINLSAQVDSVKKTEYYKVSEVRIFINDKSDITELRKQGLGIEHIKIQENYFDALLDSFQIDILIKSGYPYEIIIDDVTKDYLERTKESREKIKTKKPCQPLGFGYGSMGGFYTFDEVVAQLDTMRLLYPNLITAKDSIGASIEGRTIWAVKISDNPDVNENEPQVFYNSLIHANEQQGMMTVIYFMYYLLENYGTNPEVTYLVDNRELYFVPVFNPDGYAYNELISPDGGGMWRKNRRDNGGGIFGVDLARNFGYMWGYDDLGSSPIPSAIDYRGTGPFSEPESQTIREFCIEHNFLTSCNYHTFWNVIFPPWGYNNEQTPDSTIFNSFILLANSLNGYRNGIYIPPPENYPSNGDVLDWMYGETNEKNRIFAILPEVGGADDGGHWPPPEKIIPLAQENLYSNFVYAWGPGIIENPPFISGGTVNPKYYRSMIDTLIISAIEMNPDNYTSNAYAQILSLNDSLLNEIQLNKVDTIFTGTSILNFTGEDFFKIRFKQSGIDIPSNLSSYGNNIIKFTTAGPLKVDSIVYSPLSDFRYSIKPYIKSYGVQTEVKNITIKLFCNDSWVTNIFPDYRGCPNLLPGQMKGISAPFAVTYDSATFPGYFNLKFEIMSNGLTYWYDSKQVVVIVEDEIILSSFDLDSEGWSVNGGNIYYQNSNGNPGGFIEFDDNQDGAGIFIAPSKFLGDLTLYDQGKLKFDLKNTYDNGQDSLYGYGNVRISSSNSYADKNVIPLGYISEWTSFSIPMTAGDWGLTESGWDSLLADVIEISIQMDAQWNYYDRVGLDNFSINPNPTDLEPGLFDAIASSYKLNQNYPNPFNPSTKIGYSITQSGLVTIKVYNVLGTEIETLINEEKPIGTYELSWNAANLPSGVYFYRLQAGDFVQTRKMILLK